MRLHLWCRSGTLGSYHEWLKSSIWSADLVTVCFIVTWSGWRANPLNHICSGKLLTVYPCKYLWTYQQANCDATSKSGWRPPNGWARLERGLVHLWECYHVCRHAENKQHTPSLRRPWHRVPSGIYVIPPVLRRSKQPAIPIRLLAETCVVARAHDVSGAGGGRSQPQRRRRHVVRLIGCDRDEHRLASRGCHGLRGDAAHVKAHV